MTTFQVSDLEHLMGYIVHVAQRDINEDEKPLFTLEEALCTPKLRVYKKVCNNDALIIYSPVSHPDEVRKA